METEENLMSKLGMADPKNSTEEGSGVKDHDTTISIGPYLATRSKLRPKGEISPQHLL